MNYNRFRSRRHAFLAGFLLGACVFTLWCLFLDFMFDVMLEDDDGDDCFEYLDIHLSCDDGDIVPVSTNDNSFWCCDNDSGEYLWCVEAC